MKLSDYPKLTELCEDMAQDNGCINQHEPLETLHTALRALLSQYTSNELGPIERWLTSLSGDDFNFMVWGGDEMLALYETAPELTEEINDRIWDEAKDRKVGDRAAFVMDEG